MRATDTLQNTHCVVFVTALHASRSADPYPGEAIPNYPFSTYPNVTMWHCWYGTRTATSYWYLITEADVGTAPNDKPVLWAN